MHDNNSWELSCPQWTERKYKYPGSDSEACFLYVCPDFIFLPPSLFITFSHRWMEENQRLLFLPFIFIIFSTSFHFLYFHYHPDTNMKKKEEVITEKKNKFANTHFKEINCLGQWLCTILSSFCSFLFLSFHLMKKKKAVAYDMILVAVISWYYLYDTWVLGPSSRPCTMYVLIRYKVKYYNHLHTCT